MQPGIEKARLWSSESKSWPGVVIVQTGRERTIKLLCVTLILLLITISTVLFSGVYETANSTTVIVILGRIINMVPVNTIVTQFNDSVFAMAQLRINHGDKIILVDMESGAELIYNIQPAGDMWDSLHPFASGYTKMANVWLNALNGILPACP